MDRTPLQLAEKREDRCSSDTPAGTWQKNTWQDESLLLVGYMEPFSDSSSMASAELTCWSNIWGEVGLCEWLCQMHVRVFGFEGGMCDLMCEGTRPRTEYFGPAK